MLPAREDEARLRALREEIRRVGARLGEARSRLSRLLGGVLAFLALFVACFLLQSSSGWMTVVGVLGCAILLAIGLGETIAVGLAGRELRRIRAGLRERLAAMTLDQRARVLLPLRDDPEETWAIVGPLLREMALHPSEITPSLPPVSGSELTPDETSAAGRQR